MRFRVLWLAAVPLAAVAMPIAAGGRSADDSAIQPAAKRKPAPTIGFPRRNEIVNVGTFVTARVPKGISRRRIKRVEFQYAKKGGRYRTMHSTAPAGLAEYAALWDAGSLSGGKYLLRTRVVRRRARTLTSVSVPVRVNEQPFAVARADTTRSRRAPAFRRERTQAVTVRFDGTGSTDPDGRIVGYTWAFQGGGSESGASVQHTFPAPGDYPMSLTVTDDRGGKSTEHYVFRYQYDDEYFGLLTSFKLKTDCGCKKMTIKADGMVEGPKGFGFQPSSGIPAGHRGDLGPYNDGGGNTVDPKKKGDITVKCRFQVIAELHDESKPQLCAEGQRAQGTITVGGKSTKLNQLPEKYLSSDPRYDSSKSADDPYDPKDGRGTLEKGSCGFGDQKWCDDDYHGGGGSDGKGKGNSGPPGKHKTYDGQERITWLDAPGMTFSPSGLKPSGASFRAHFEAKVSGGLGECKCSWDVRIEIDKDGNVTSNQVENVSCS